MPEFSVNPHRRFPYKQFKFRVKWDGKYVPGVTKVSGLKRRTEVIVHRSGGEGSNVQKSPGKTKFEPIVLKRGRTHDDAFEKWASKVFSFDTGHQPSLKDFQKDIAIDLFNEAGQLVMSFHIFRCWPSEYTALGDLDSNDAMVAYESITLQHEGWERDKSVAEPTEP